MRLAWLLFARSFRHNWRRFLLLALALGIGVFLLFLAVAGLNGLANRMNSASWQQTIRQSATASTQLATSPEPLYAMLSSGSSVDSFWRDKQINVTRLVAGGDTSPQFRDMPTPAKGEYYVSPGLKKIIDEHPEDAMGSRFGDKPLGLIPDNYVVSPDELSVVSHMDLAEAQHLEKAGMSVMKLYTIDQRPAIEPRYSAIVTPVLYLAVLIFLLPIMLLVSAATRLGGSQREQRYAALRLIGATRTQIRRIMTLESLIASLVGVIFGITLYMVARPFVLEFTFNGMRFWPHEVTIPTVQIAGIAGATLIFTIFISWWSMRRVQISPLGVARRSIRHRRLHWWRILPLGIGLAAVGYVMSPLFSPAPMERGNVAALFIFASVVVLMFGLLIAGPFVTQKLAAAIARYTRHPSVLLGMKYIAFNARGVFRSVSGVVVALFVGSFLLACASGMQHFMTQLIGNNPYSRLQTNAVLIGSHTGSDALPDGQASTLQALDYVRSVVEVKEVSYTFAVMPCQAAAAYTKTPCPDDEGYVGVSFNAQISPNDLYGTTEQEVYQQIGKSSPYANLSAIKPSYLAKIDYDNIDKLRSDITDSYAEDASAGVYLFDGTTTNTPFIHPLITELAELARIGIAATVSVAIASLAIATVGGLLERRRSLATLRLGGMTVGGLHRVILIEALVPLLGVASLSAGLGVGVGYVLMRQLSAAPEHVLSLSYLVLFGCCIAVAIAITTCVLPLLKRIANPDSIRTE